MSHKVNGDSGQLGQRHDIIAWIEVQEEFISVAEQCVRGVLDTYSSTRLMA